MVDAQHIVEPRETFMSRISKANLRLNLLINPWYKEEKKKQAPQFLGNTNPYQVLGESILGKNAYQTLEENILHKDDTESPRLNKVWTKTIPNTNLNTMRGCLVLVFTLDLALVIASPPLIGYWFMMIGVLVLFGIFIYLESYIFAKNFANTTSFVDYILYFLITIRNLLFVINCIPVIQLLGLYGLFLTSFTWLPVYVLFLFIRFLVGGTPIPQPVLVQTAVTTNQTQ